MDLSTLEEHYELVEELGFITNCPPDIIFQVYHDRVYTYCDYLNEFALTKGLYNEAPYEAVHLNEPAGDYIALFKKEGDFEAQAKKVLNKYADHMAKEANEPRSWKK